MASWEDDGRGQKEGAQADPDAPDAARRRECGNGHDAPRRGAYSAQLDAALPRRDVRSSAGHP
eukprot:3702522-Pyramimonas_sp.AAC.1